MIFEARCFATARRSLSQKVNWGFISCLFSTIVARDASFGELLYASWMCVQKLTNAPPSLSSRYGQDKCGELSPEPLWFIVNVIIGMVWDEVNKSSAHKS